MTRTLSPTRRSRMRLVQERSMGDICVHLQRVATQNEIGEDIVEWVEAETYACGFAPTQTTEDHTTGEVQIRPASLRLPLEAEGQVGSEDAIAITHRYLEPLTEPLHFQVNGTPMPGPSALVMMLEAVSV